MKKLICLLLCVLLTASAVFVAHAEDTRTGTLRMLAYNVSGIPLVGDFQGSVFTTTNERARRIGKLLNETGVDAAEFLLAANKGEPVKPLVKVASGGEISRIMLAMKAALSDADRIETLIFDEIDTGISGMVANTVAEKMRALGQKHQVLCVTHLPQIAAFADAQYVAYKYSDAEKTHSVTKRLTEAERAKELARIMGSEESDAAAMEHARRLLEAAKQ